MEAKHWIIFGVIVAAVVGGLIYMSPKSTIDVDDIGKAGSGKILAGKSETAILVITYLATKTPRLY